LGLILQGKKPSFGKKKNPKFYYLIPPPTPPHPPLFFSPSPSKTKKNTLAQKKQGNGHNKSAYNDSRHEFILKGVLACYFVVSFVVTQSSKVESLSLASFTTPLI